VAPALPSAPVAPVAPAAPVVPVAPAAPAAPAFPSLPSAPVFPVAPVGPVAPATPRGPAGPRGPALPGCPISTGCSASDDTQWPRNGMTSSRVNACTQSRIVAPDAAPPPRPTAPRATQHPASSTVAACLLRWRRSGRALADRTTRVPQALNIKRRTFQSFRSMRSGPCFRFDGSPPTRLDDGSID